MLVTGASGYLGSEVARQASARGWRVVGTYLTREPKCESIRLDVRDAAAVDDAVRDVRPDRVIHTAYVQHGRDARAVTLDGAANVAAAAARARARLIHLSTDVVFSGHLGRPYREGDRTDPVTDYGRDKADAERAVAERAPAAAIVRTSVIVAGREQSPSEQVALAAAAGRAEYGLFTDEIRCPIAAADLAAALIELAHSALSGVLHVAGPDAVSRYELACLVARRHGMPTDRIPAESGAREAGRPSDCRLDTSWARTLLSTRIRGIREVLRPE